MDRRPSWKLIGYHWHPTVDQTQPEDRPAERRELYPAHEHGEGQFAEHPGEDVVTAFLRRSARHAVGDWRPAFPEHEEGEDQLADEPTERRDWHPADLALLAEQLAELRDWHPVHEHGEGQSAE